MDHYTNLCYMQMHIVIKKKYNYGSGHIAQSESCKLKNLLIGVARRQLGHHGKATAGARRRWQRQRRALDGGGGGSGHSARRRRQDSARQRQQGLGSVATAGPQLLAARARTERGKSFASSTAISFLHRTWLSSTFGWQ
jgi:hypothetical protein